MDNCAPIAELADVDGFLVGGAATRLVYAGHAAGVKARCAGILRNDLHRYVDACVLRASISAIAHAVRLTQRAALPARAERVRGDRVPRRGEPPRRRLRRRQGGALRARRGAARPGLHRRGAGEGEAPACGAAAQNATRGVRRDTVAGKSGLLKHDARCLGRGRAHGLLCGPTLSAARVL